MQSFWGNILNIVSKKTFRIYKFGKLFFRHQIKRNNFGKVVDLKRASRMGRWIYLGLAGAVIAVFSIFFVNKFFGHAEVAYFYPQNCLGEWQNSEKAQDAPENFGTDLNSFDDSNSATSDFLSNKIFCGNFMADGFEGRGEIGRVSLTLVWNIEGEAFPTIPVNEIDTINLENSNEISDDESGNQPEVLELDKNDATSSEAIPAEQTNLKDLEKEITPILDEKKAEDQEAIIPVAPIQNNGSTSSEDLKEEISPDSNEKIIENQEAITPVAPIQNNESTSSAYLNLRNIESSKISWFKNLIAPKVRAQSEDLMPELNIEKDENVEIINEIDIQVETSSENLPEEPITPIIHEEPIIPGNDFVKLDYSVDSETWIDLVKVNPENWKFLTIELPIRSWDELRKLQVGLKGIENLLPEFPKIFLDGMVLGVEYEVAPVFNEVETKISQEPAGEVKIPDNLPIIIISPEKVPEPVQQGREFYGSNETPSFDFDLEDLPSGEPSSYIQPRFQGQKLASVSPPKREKESFLGKKLGRAFLTWAGLDFQAKADDGILPGIVFLDDSRPVVAQVLDNQGNPTLISPVIFTVNNRVRISVPEPERSFKPGKYKLKLWMLKNSKVYLTETEFVWGVLAINFNKSIYALNDKVKVLLAVLDDSGHTVCDARVEVKIINPSLIESNFSTQDSTIIQNSTCGPDNVTSEPDYFFEFLETKEEGNYQVEAIVFLSGQTRKIVDNFLVQTDPLFEVERVGPIRIFPPANYRMTLRITAKKDFDGQVKEFLPSVFNVVTEVLTDQTDYGNVKEITWNIRLGEGETRELNYDFKAPNVSPYLYKLGPAVLVESGEEIFREARQWQIASDAVVNTGSLMAYGDANDEDNINVQFLNSTSTWGGEITTIDVTAEIFAINHVVVRAAPTRNEYLVGQLKARGRLDILRYDGSSWSLLHSVAGTTYNQACNTVFGSCNQSFDIAYEQLSGRAVIMYTKDQNKVGGADHNTVYYVTWDGNATSSESSFDFCPGLGCSDSLTASGWIRLVPKGVNLTDNRSNEILVMMLTNTPILYAGVWNSASNTLNSTTTVTTRTPTAHGRPFDAAWETISGDAVIVFSSSTANTTTPFSYKKLTNGVWDSTATILGTVSSTKGIWVVMAADPLSNRLAVGLTASTTAATGWPAIWKTDGVTSGWTLGTGDTSLEREMAIGATAAWERFGSGSGTSSALFTLNNDASAENTLYETWISGTGFSTLAAIPGLPITSNWEDDGATKKLIQSPNSDEIMLVGVDMDNDLGSRMWDGSSWDTNATNRNLNTSVSSASDCTTMCENNAFDFAYMPYSPWSLNWRWYNGTSTADTPTPALAAENTSTTIASSSMKLRLRFNVAERSGNSQTDARKKLQFTTSTSPDASSTIWTDVGNVGSSTVWRYQDCSSGDSVCNDGQAIGATVLSSSTNVGWWNLSNNATAGSGMDQASTTIVELEFPIEGNSVPVDGLTNYFRIYDVSQGSPVYRQQTSWPATPCASAVACTYPSIVLSDPNPIVSAVSLNDGNPIILTPNTTTTIYANFTVTDADGCSDVFSSGNTTSTIYRSGLSFDCTADDRNCYRVETTTNNCSGGTSAQATSTFQVYYFADATDASSSYSAQNWLAKIQVRDSSGNTGSSTASGVELNTLVALEVSTSSINYGTVNPNSNTGQNNPVTPVKNAGNGTSTVLLSGTALISGSNQIATSSQHYASSTFVFGGNEQQLSGTNTTITGVSFPAYEKILNSLGDWNFTTDLPSINANHSTLAYNGYLYVFGGDMGSGGSVSSTIWYSAINSSTGALSSWGTTTPLPSAMISPVLTAYNGRLYSIGGITNPGSNSHTSSTRYVSINSNGTLGFWGAGVGGGLPVGLSNHSILAKNGYLYVFGGAPDGGTTATSTVLYAALDPDNGSIGAWSNTTALPVARKDHAVFERNGNIYVFGGRAPSSITSSILYAPINSDGSLGNWTTTNTPLPVAVTSALDTMSNSGNYFYLIMDTTSYYSLLENNDFNWATTTSISPLLSQSEYAVTVYNGYLYASGGSFINGFEQYVATSTVTYSPVYNDRSSRDIFWGLEVPNGSQIGTYSGTVNFTGSYDP